MELASIEFEGDLVLHDQVDAAEDRDTDLASNPPSTRQKSNASDAFQDALRSGIDQGSEPRSVGNPEESSFEVDPVESIRSDRPVEAGHRDIDRFI